MGLGRPSDFDYKLIAKIASLYGAGKTDKEVAEIIGVCEKTLNNWKNRQPDFLQSIKEAKQAADEMVEQSLFKRALGYTIKETKVFVSHGKVIKVEVDKHIPGDTIAQIFWLKNRRPDLWMKPQPVIQPDEPKTIEAKKLKTFEEFCVDAKYPKPFPKQVEMRDFAFDQTDPRLILGSRGYGKTDYLTILGTAYAIYVDWFTNPTNITETNLIITKSRVRNTAMINEIANALEANGVPLDKRNASVVTVKGLIGKDASVEAITIKTSMRGRHPKRVLMDDPVTEEDVSDATRQIVQRKYNEVLKLCSNVVIIGQPAHRHDLYAKIRGIISKLELPHGSIPELDHDLEAQRLAGVDENSIQMSYFLKIPEDGTTPFDKINRIDEFPSHGTSIAFIDPSHEGNDYTAISIVKQYGQGIAVVGFTYKKAWNHCLDEMIPLFKKYGVAKVGFETNALGDQPIIMLRQLLNGTPIGVTGRRTITNKHSRIMAAGSFAHLIHLSKESHKIYADQVIEYEYKAKHDDAPDSLATALEWIGLIKGK